MRNLLLAALPGCILFASCTAPRHTHRADAVEFKYSYLRYDVYPDDGFGMPYHKIVEKPGVVWLSGHYQITPSCARVSDFQRVITYCK